MSCLVDSQNWLHKGVLVFTEKKSLSHYTPNQYGCEAIQIFRQNQAPFHYISIRRCLKVPVKDCVALL